MNIHTSITRNSQKVEATQMSINHDWINKMKHIHTAEHYLVIKGNEVLRQE